MCIRAGSEGQERRTPVGQGSSVGTGEAAARTCPMVPRCTTPSPQAPGVCCGEAVAPARTPALAAGEPPAGDQPPNLSALRDLGRHTWIGKGSALGATLPLWGHKPPDVRGPAQLLALRTNNPTFKLKKRLIKTIFK